MVLLIIKIIVSDNPDESKQKKTEYVAEKKSLPDLDKYWKAVNDDPTDFTAWTYLLQYVDQEVYVILLLIILNIGAYT